MQFIPLKSPVIKQGDFWQKLSKLIKGRLSSGDILVIASKLIALEQDDLAVKDEIKPTTRAKKLANNFKIDPRFVQVVLKQADKIIGGVKGTLLTVKDSVVIANAGVDHSNAPKGYFILWPKKPEAMADKIKRFVQKECKKRIGVIIADSHCLPRRLGTSGLALAISGFEGVVDQRKQKDLYGRPLKITYSNLADDLAAASAVLMGEAAEKVPLVIIKKPPVTLSNSSAKVLTNKLKIKREACLFYQSDL
ncbi:MAG: coenzyme F420-0:L-glutamate ligase [Patescibacteria group bacterium]